MKVDQQSMSTTPLLPVPLITTKSLSWKRVGKFLIRVFIVSYLLFSAYCPMWLALQSECETEKSLNTVPSCPCRVNTTWDNEQFGFNIDPACDARKSGYWNCQLHHGAKGCYRQKSTTNIAGAQCCYDNDGRWIADWRKGAGTLDFYYPGTWRNFSTYQHFFSDGLSYLSCRFGVSTIFNACEHYMRYRPPGQCKDVLMTAQCENNDLNLSTSKECA